jgi:hypothetical protein
MSAVASRSLSAAYQPDSPTTASRVLPAYYSDSASARARIADRTGLVEATDLSTLVRRGATTNEGLSRVTDLRTALLAHGHAADVKGIVDVRAAVVHQRAVGELQCEAVEVSAAAVRVGTSGTCGTLP